MTMSPSSDTTRESILTSVAWNNLYDMSPSHLRSTLKRYYFFIFDILVNGAHYHTEHENNLPESAKQKNKICLEPSSVSILLQMQTSEKSIGLLLVTADHFPGDHLNFDPIVLGGKQGGTAHHMWDLCLGASLNFKFLNKSEDSKLYLHHSIPTQLLGPSPNRSHDKGWLLLFFSLLNPAAGGNFRSVSLTKLSRHSI